MPAVSTRCRARPRSARSRNLGCGTAAVRKALARRRLAAAQSDARWGALPTTWVKTAVRTGAPDTHHPRVFTAQAWEPLQVRSLLGCVLTRSRGCCPGTPEKPRSAHRPASPSARCRSPPRAARAVLSAGEGLGWEVGNGTAAPSASPSAPGLPAAGSGRWPPTSHTRRGVYGEDIKRAARVCHQWRYNRRCRVSGIVQRACLPAHHCADPKVGSRGRPGTAVQGQLLWGTGEGCRPSPVLVPIPVSFLSLSCPVGSLSAPLSAAPQSPHQHLLPASSKLLIMCRKLVPSFIY